MERITRNISLMHILESVPICGLRDSKNMCKCVRRLGTGVSRNNCKMEGVYLNLFPSPGIFFIQALLMGIIGLAITAFWLWMLIDCIKNEPSSGNDKIVWVLVIALLHTLGALVYLIIRRPARISAYGR